jgi:hypothetical protein
MWIFDADAGIMIISSWCSARRNNPQEAKKRGRGLQEAYGRENCKSEEVRLAEL